MDTEIFPHLRTLSNKVYSKALLSA